VCRKERCGKARLIALARKGCAEPAEGPAGRSPTRRHRQLRDESGQALIEFAIVVPVILLIVVGILYFGRFLNYTIDATHLANIAVRFAAVNADPACAAGTPPNSCGTTLANYVKSQADPGEFSSGSSDVTAPVKVCITAPSGSEGTQGSPVQATVTATFHFGPFLNIPIPVSETATMMLEQTPDSSIITNDCST
jgi:Flp pilus assembly protein TadG